jgi:ubiquinone/menaquinone biosynthesis C-methylase UbiE
MDEKQEHQRDYYAGQAALYDSRWHRENPNHLRKLAEIARCFDELLEANPEGHDFLEVGAGTGIHARQFLESQEKKIRSFVLSDLSPQMLEQARARIGPQPNVEYLVSPGESLATPRKFDGIYVSGAMHHFSRPCPAIAEMRDHLKPNGVLVICEPIVWNPLNFLRAASMREDWGQFVVTRSNVRSWLAEAGMRVSIDRVLHWKGSGIATTLWPYERLERIGLLAPLAVMFLFAARLATPAGPA